MRCASRRRCSSTRSAGTSRPEAPCASSASTPDCRPPASAWSTSTAMRCATSPAAPSAPATWTGDLPARLKVLFDGIGELAARYQPDAAAVEIVFVNVNPQSTLLLGQARGACADRAGDQQPHGFRVHGAADEAGGGRPWPGRQGAGAGDGQAAARPAGLPGADAADALGIAITHAHVGASLARLGQATVLGAQHQRALSGRTDAA